MPETPEQVKSFIAKVCEEALDGWTDLDKFGYQLLLMEQAIKGIKENLRGHILDEVYKNPESKLQPASRRTYNYKNDSRWTELNKALKDHEAMLKALKKPVFDEDTGEEYLPPLVSTSEYFKIKK